MRIRFNTAGIGLALLLALALAVSAQDGESVGYEVVSGELPSGVLEAVVESFTEYGALDSALVDNDGNFELDVETTFSISFVGEGAGNKNSVGYFTYDADGAVTEEQIVFANYSGTGSGLAGGGELSPGDTVTIGTFSPGENVGFFLISNGYYNETYPHFYTVSELNSDGLDHDAVISLGELGTVIGFEDLKNLGDADYNDALLLITAAVAAMEEDPELALENAGEGAAGGTVLSDIQAAAEEVSRLLGISISDANAVLSEYGLIRVKQALRYAADAGSFWSGLLGYDVLHASAAGGGGSVDGSASSDWVDVQLRNPITGEEVTTELVTLTVVEESGNILDVVVAAYNPATGTYAYDLGVFDLAPGQYELYLGFGNGTHHLMTVFVASVE